MTQAEISAARMALPMLQQGILLEQVVNSITSRLSGATEQEIRSGAGYAFNAISYAIGAEADNVRQFGDVPFAEEFSYNIRVRLTYDTRTGGRGFIGTMDVIATAADSIEAVKEYARKHVNDIRQKRDTVPGGGGDDGGLIDPIITIGAIFNADDTVTAAKLTVQA